MSRSRPIPDQSEVERQTNVPETKPLGPTPPIPPQNLVKLGETIRIGELEVTPLSVITTPLTLVRSIEPTTERQSEGSSLVLRLRLANVSQDQNFAPLERGMLRAPNSPLDRSYIETPKGRTISLYPLAADSEWSIAGQDFAEIKPGERVETIVASERVSENLLRRRDDLARTTENRVLSDRPARRTIHQGRHRVVVERRPSWR